MSETMPLIANKVDETFLFDGARLRVLGNMRPIVIV
jgi:hypothetical protein